MEQEKKLIFGLISKNIADERGAGTENPGIFEGGAKQKGGSLTIRPAKLSKKGEELNQNPREITKKGAVT